MQVLIVEDEVRLAKALKEILSKERYMADVVHDGNTAWEYLQSGIYDAVVLDVMIPGMDGIALSETGITLTQDRTLDFGALAKGYAADLCRARMEEAGISYVYMSTYEMAFDFIRTLLGGLL